MRVTKSRDVPTVATPGGNTISIVAAAWTGASETMVLAQRQDPGGTNPMHRKSSEAVIVILEGVLTLVTEDDETVLSTGDVAIVPAATIHSLQNRSRLPTRWVTTAAVDTRFETSDGQPIKPAWLERPTPAEGTNVQACHVPPQMHR